MALQQTSSASETSTTIPGLLTILVKDKLLTQEQVDKITRAKKLQAGSEEDIIIRMGILSDVEIAQAVARYAKLPFMKIDVRDLET